MIAYDIDGVLGGSLVPEGDWCVISGRTWAEYDQTCSTLAQRVPVYIRGAGAFGDRVHAGRFKAMMAQLLAVEEFFEDDPLQAKMIRDANPSCVVNLVLGGHLRRMP